MSQNQDQRQDKSWTVMVYLAGENNLAEECIYALKEMRRARPRRGSEREIEKRVKVIAQLDASGLGGSEARYILDGTDVDGDLGKRVIATRDTSETSYRSVLKDFVSTSIVEKNGDGLAKYYMLVLSGHGGGVARSDFLSRDVESPDTLSIPKIQWVLQQVREDVAEMREKRKATGGNSGTEPFRINVLGLDSCLMSMAEIGYELREYVDFMVGAEGFEPNTGWPYERILSDILTEHEELEPRRLAEMVVSKYVTYYSDFLPAGRSVDQAANDLRVMRGQSEFVVRMKNLSDVLKRKLDDKESRRHILLAHWEAQSYKDDQYVDLYDFCDLLDRSPDRPEGDEESSVILRGVTVDPEIVKACRWVKAVLKHKPDPVIIKSCYSGPAVQHSHGLSIYFPWSDVIESYRDLEFARDTGWLDFLEKYVEKTRRERRKCPDETQQTVPLRSKLCYNPRLSGFDFLPAENKDVPLRSRVLGNNVGTMKNPALDYVTCACVTPESTAGGDESAEKSEESDTPNPNTPPPVEEHVRTKTRKKGSSTPKK
ncbi:MAG TPA: clostripain-related cysteine peptidase [Pyrinomonadaceae bacterium]